MTTSTFKWMRLAAALVMSILALSPLAHAQPAKAATPGATGIVCTTGPSFSITAEADYIQMPDMNTMYMWSYGNTGGSFQHPGPVLCVNEGQTVTVTLTNSLPYSQRTSLIFPGQSGVLANSLPDGPDLANNSRLQAWRVAGPSRKIGRAHV